MYGVQHECGRDGKEHCYDSLWPYPSWRHRLEKEECHERDVQQVRKHGDTAEISVVPHVPDQEHHVLEYEDAQENHAPEQYFLEVVFVSFRKSLCAQQYVEHQRSSAHRMRQVFGQFVHGRTLCGLAASLIKISKTFHIPDK